MKRVAFLGRGVHTLPTYRALLNKLTDEYSITVYSEVPLQPEWLTLPHKYSIQSFKAMRWPRRIREIFFTILLVKEQLRHRFDLIHAHSTFPTGFAAVILQKIFRIPAIVSLDGAEGSSLPDLRFGDAHHFKRKWINKWVISQATVVTALTNFQRDDVYKNLKIQRDIRVIVRGVDLQQFWFLRNEEIKSPVRFLSVGYLSPLKDPETLLKAFFLIQQKIDCLLIHVGRDYMDGRIHQMANDMGLGKKVRFVAPVVYEDMHKFYQEADILLHTSRFESQGMVIAEAMAAGTIVCGTRVGLMSDLSEYCCITTPAGDEKALALAVTGLLSDGQKIRTLRENAYEWTRNHSLDHSVKNHRELYLEIMTRNEKVDNART